MIYHIYVHTYLDFFKELRVFSKTKSKAKSKLGSVL